MRVPSLSLSTIRPGAHFAKIAGAVVLTWVLLAVALRHKDGYKLMSHGGDDKEATSQDTKSPSSSLAAAAAAAALATSAEAPPLEPTHDPIPDALVQGPLTHIDLGARYLIEYPLHEPWRDKFWEAAQRAQMLRLWIEQIEASAASSKDREQAARRVSRALQVLFPYLEQVNGHELSPPMTTIRKRLGLDQKAPRDDGGGYSTAGIVIPVGDRNVRYASHLIGSLTKLHKTQLPIQIAYAGDGDLSEQGRKTLTDAAADGVALEFLDVTRVFDDGPLRLNEGGWAIKPFAALASRFAQVILLDADAVFIQKPEAMLGLRRFRETGAMLFHDRLIWKGRFKARHHWWHEEIRHPSAELGRSRVWSEGFSEEQDSGAVVVDMARLDVLLGMLHVGWQNMRAVRKETTYLLMYGDKETYWMGLEMTGSKYAFSPHYGGIVGWLGLGFVGEGDTLGAQDKHKGKDNGKHDGEDETEQQQQQKKKKQKRGEAPPVSVCSFNIAHFDDDDHLLWFNGGLLKNKVHDNYTYEVPTHWMVDHTWYKGGAKADMSCMTGAAATAKELTEAETNVLAKSIELAKWADKELSLI